VNPDIACCSKFRL